LSRIRNFLRGRAQTAADAPVLDLNQTSAHTEVEAEPPPAKFINPVCGMAVDTIAPKHIEQYACIAYYDDGRGYRRRCLRADPRTPACEEPKCEWRAGKPRQATRRRL